MGRRCDFESGAPKAIGLGGPGGSISWPRLWSLERMAAGPVGTSLCRNARGPVGIENFAASLEPRAGLPCSRSPIDLCADPFEDVAVDLDLRSSSTSRARFSSANFSRCALDRNLGCRFG